MARLRNKEMLTRLLGHVLALQGVRHGLRVDQLVQRCGASRATVYRDMQVLEQAGVPVQTQNVDGETRYLLDWRLPPMKPTPLQVTALLMVRGMLEPLTGTRLMKELDALVGAVAGKPGPPAVVAARPASIPQVKEEVIAALDRGVLEQKRLVLHYRKPGSTEAEQREVDPQELRLKGEQLYLCAFDLTRKDWRLFKPARTEQVEVLAQHVEEHPGYDAEALFAHAVGVWRAEPVEVAVGVVAEVARLVGEWPLSEDQRVEPQADGSVIVRATVAGTMEAMHWVLRWGAHAQALEPPDFREMVKRELETALGAYGAGKGGGEEA